MADVELTIDPIHHHNKSEIVDSPSVGFDAASTRLGFIRKVYGIIAVQLTLTVLISAIAMATPYSGFGAFLSTNNWICWLCIAVNITSVLLIFCYSQQVPYNFIFLGIFTLSESLIVAKICVEFTLIGEGTSVLTAAIMTLGVTIGLTLYAALTKTDFTFKGGMITVFIVAFLLFGMFACFQSYNLLHSFYCLLGVIVYGFYIIFDTQLIVGGHTHKLAIDDYTMGALMLYVDIIGLFLYILAEVARKR